MVTTESGNWQEFVRESERIKQKGLKLTTLAIIGSGILGRSLLYTLAKEQKSFEKITLFSSEEFLPACSLASTAIVAPRGLGRGHSPLGDLLMDGFDCFVKHVGTDQPEGVEVIPQLTGATQKLDQFLNRYPHANKGCEFQNIRFHDELHLAQDQAYLVNPQTYLTWLMSKALKARPEIEIVDDLVIQVEQQELIKMRTQKGSDYKFDKVIFTAGAYSRFWSSLAPKTKLNSSQSVQGSYLEFNNLKWEIPSFSLTLDGDNLIWNSLDKKLLIGSTSLNVVHNLSPVSQLKEIYFRLMKLVDLDLPAMDLADIRVGLREKAQKREPYVVNIGNVMLMGGLYKNGYSLSLKMAKDLSRQFL